MSGDQVFANFDEMTWPLPNSERAKEVSWKLRHSPELTTKDRMLAASAMDAYAELASCNQKKRAMVVRNLKRALAGEERT